LLVRWAPRGVLLGARALSERATRLPGPFRGPAGRGVNVLSTLLERHDRVATRLQGQSHRVVHAWIDPWRLARHVERHHLEALRNGRDPDVVVLDDEDALPLAWRLARRFPAAEVLNRPSTTALRRRLDP